MQPQVILRVVGIAALVISVLFAALAVHYYLTRHIRAVMDDLSGKARAQGVARARNTAAAGARGGVRRSTPTATAAPAPAPAPAPAVVEAPAPTPAPFAAPSLALADEDGAGTVLVAAAHAALPAQSAEDDLATLVDAGEPDATPATSTHEAKVTFRLTRRIVLIHSPEVIANSEETLA